MARLAATRRFRYHDGAADHVVTATPAADGAGYLVTVDDTRYADGAAVGVPLDRHAIC